MTIKIDKQELKQVIKDAQLELLSEITDNKVFLLFELFMCGFGCFYFLNYFWFNIFLLKPLF